MNSIAIESTRLALSTFAPTDADDLFACITPAITRFMAWEPPASREAFADVWRSWMSAIHEGTEHYFVIRAKADGCCLGIVGLHALQTPCPELGIWLRSESHGQGFGKEAIGAVISWASKELQPSYFEYPVAEENIASRRIAESLDGSIAGRRSNPKYNSIVYRIPNCVPR
jgi:RimJ/RimL family protein N-acetyltransferase